MKLPSGNGDTATTCQDLTSQLGKLFDRTNGARFAEIASPGRVLEAVDLAVSTPLPLSGASAAANDTRAARLPAPTNMPFFKPNEKRLESQG
ncbi:MAG: hypothetical protein ABL962_16330 [Fimbriimonadaceae bacterium]